MGGTRVLVGTRKGAFVLTSDEARTDWKVDGPHFPGWEIYHLKGSPVNPDRIYASQSSGWFGQVIQRSDDGGASWETVGNDFTLRRRPRRAPVVRRLAAAVGLHPGVAPRAVAARRRDGLRRRRGRRAVQVHRRRRHAGPSCPACASTTPARSGSPAPAACACTRSSSTRPTPTGSTSRSPRPARSAPPTAAQTWQPINKGLRSGEIPDQDSEVGHCVHRIDMHP